MECGGHSVDGWSLCAVVRGAGPVHGVLGLTPISLEPLCNQNRHHSVTGIVIPWRSAKRSYRDVLYHFYCIVSFLEFGKRFKGQSVLMSPLI